MVDYLADKFNAYVEAVPREEIFTHTDRDDYIAGENIWMKIYCVDRRSMEPSDRSRIAYVELLNTGNRPVVQKRFAIYKGYGTGQLILPDSLSPGNYSLRVYTNWMKNFFPYNCYEKGIRIYNVANDNIPLSINESMANADQTNNDGINSPDHDWLFAVTTIKLNNGGLKVALSADDRFYEMNGERLYIFVQTHGNIDTIAPLKIQGKNAEITIPEGKLTPGINQITVFNSRGIPVAEKYCYTPSGAAGNFDVSVEGTFKPRGKLNLRMMPARMDSSVPASAVLSIAVTPDPGRDDLPGIEEYLVFGTEFILHNRKGHGSLADYSTQTIDSALMNTKSNWINWKNILSGNLPDLVHMAENEEHFLSGKLKPDDPSSSSTPATVLLFIPGREPEFQHSVTDSLGNFTFSLHIDEEVKDLIIMPDDEYKKSKILIESSFSDNYMAGNKSEPVSDEPLSSTAGEMIVNHQVKRIYGINEAGDPLKPLFLPLRHARFYGKPDIELNLADYVALPKMEEVFFELLPRISLKKRNDVFEIRITDRINENRFELTPNLFLDGVKINDASIIANLDPSEVEKIDVVKDKYAIGDYFFPGILNVTTAKADFSSIQLPGYMIRFNYRVAEPAFSFVIPDYSSADQMNSSLPDFRNTLYWNPSVHLDKEGKGNVEFWASDLPGKYKIVFQGICPDGKVVYKEKYFTVE